MIKQDQKSDQVKTENDKNKKEPRREPPGKDRKDLEKKIKDLEKKSQEYLSGWQRSQADYQNLLKTTAKEREGLSQQARKEFVLKFLPVYNNLKLAFVYLPEEIKSQEWVKGILHIKDQMSAAFKELGVEQIKTKGQKFDPVFHEAVANEPASQDISAGYILREVEPGYTLAGEVIVPAKVIVAE